MAATFRTTPEMLVAMSRWAQYPTHVDNSLVAQSQGQGVPTAGILSDAKERGPQFLL